MDTLNQATIKKIEAVLNICFFDWQKNYLLDEPMVLNMRLTGRRTGKTLVYTIKKLFESSEPLMLRNSKEVVNSSDWWSCETRMDRAIGHPYVQWYRCFVRDIYETLKDNGIVTREVIF